MATDVETRPDTETSSERLRQAGAELVDQMRGVRDAISVKRAFGEPYEVDDVLVIPVARVGGGAGGGSGEGTGDVESGSGFGSGFGIGVRPVGVFELRDGRATWKPVVDATRLAHGGQVLVGIFAVCATLILLRRR